MAGERRGTVSSGSGPRDLGLGHHKRVGPLPLREFLLPSIFGAPGQQVKEGTLRGLFGQWV